MIMNADAAIFSTSSLVVGAGIVADTANSVVPSLALLLVIISDMGEFQD